MIELKILRQELEMAKQIAIEEQKKFKMDVVKRALRAGLELGYEDSINKINLILEQKELSNKINDLLK